MLGTLQVVVFPSPNSDDPILNRLIHILCETAPVYYVTSRQRDVAQVNTENPLKALPEDIIFTSRADLNLIWNNSTIAFVAHPYWVHAAASMRPKHLITYAPGHMAESEDGLLKSCREQLTAISSLVCSVSEMSYLNDAFRGFPALLLQKDRPEHQQQANAPYPIESANSYDTLFQKAVQELAREDAVSVHHRQWADRVQYYQALREHSGPHETISFLLSVYLYLLNDRNALRYAEEAFLQAVMKGRANALITHYRFISAIHAQQGRIRLAVDTYGITAYSETDMKKYHSILKLLADGHETLALAELYRVNDDYRAALSMLEQLPDQTARHFTFQLCRETARLEKALEQVRSSDLMTEVDRHEFRILSGSVEAMRGDRHTAVRLFMEAAASNEDVLIQILALDALDEKVRILEQGS